MNRQHNGQKKNDKWTLIDLQNTDLQNITRKLRSSNMNHTNNGVNSCSPSGKQFLL